MKLMVDPLLPSSSPSAHDLQNHLYIAFLEGRTADIALRVRGTWSAVYKLHRVVLIQSGFFRSLFTAGFSEAASRLNTHQIGPDEIDLVFDDLNITRAAFEICVARLYGGGPQLYIPSSLIPSTAQPLSSSFFEGLNWNKRAESHHPASPRFLVSLLATAVYLSIPSTAAQALSCILSTIGPYTVVEYLNFALGHPIAPPGDVDLDAAIGLEHIAHLFNNDGSLSSEDSANEDDQISQQESDLFIRKENPEDYKDFASANNCAKFYYGAISDKIGEACACWLVRWAPDTLAFEEFLEGIIPSASPVQSSGRASSMFVNKFRIDANNNIPRIWRRGGLSARWVAALVSADSLFVSGECGRYEFARRVVELRRHGGIAEDEAEWMNMFENGLYYENMTMEDIFNISRDISPTTQRPFVPLYTLQAALWRQSALRIRISGSKPSASSTVPSRATSPPIEKELGIGLKTSELGSTPQIEEEESHFCFPIPGDSSTRFGESGSLLNEKLPFTTMDDLYKFLRSPSISPNLSSPTGITHVKHNGRRSNSETPASESTFFGLLPQRYIHSASVQSDLSGNQKWTLYPPCRFSVEFWDLDYLKEKSRLHSQTVWYAGSLFNVYVQVVKKKGQVQLGIYLHRQSSVDPVPGASVPSLLLCPDTVNVPGLQGEKQTRAPKTSSPTALPTPGTPPASRAGRSTLEPSSLPSTPVTAGFSQSPSNHGLYGLPAIGNPMGPRQPYRDPRSSIVAYFAISIASATGTSQTRFSSAPDEFSIGQSWGWKSSSLRTEEFIEVSSDNAGPRTTPLGSEVSLRATVVLGLI